MSVPLPPTPLIGRDAEVAQVEARLQGGARLVTLVGPPGVGKTRLALHIAQQLLQAAQGAVEFVPLDTIGDAELVPAVIARTLDTREAGGSTIVEAIQANLRDRPMLLVLDNFEHVIAAAPVIGALLDGCPALRLLVTSRTPLRLRAEIQVPVEPLALPRFVASSHSPAALGSEAGSLVAIEEAAAVQLFMARANAVQPAPRLDPVTAPVVAAICVRLDGLPLAIELAAARTKLFSLRELLERLSARLALLTGGPLDAPVRHQTLRAAIDWSHELLGPDDKRIFRLLSVFPGGVSFDALEAVVAGVTANRTPDAGAAASTDLANTLGALIDHSLVRRQEDPGGGSRFTMLETIREYAAEQLRTNEEAEAALLHATAWFLALARPAGAALVGPDQAAWLARLEREHDNLREVLRWTLQAGRAALGLELAVAFWRFWQTRGYLSEGRAWIDRLLANAERAPASVRAEALFGAATFAFDQGDYAGATAYGERSLTLNREIDSPQAADVLLMLAAVAFRRSSYAAATAQAEESLHLARAAGDRRLAGRCLNLLGIIAMDEGRFIEAQERLQAALAEARVVGDLRTAAITLNNLGLNAHRLDDFVASRAYLEESLLLNRQLGNKTEIARNLNTLSQVDETVGDADAAWACALEALEIARETDNRGAITEALNRLTGLARVRGELAAARGYSISHLRVAREIDYPIQILAALSGASHIAEAEGKIRHAVRLFGAAETLRGTMQLAQHASMARAWEARIEALRARLGEAAFRAAWAEGSVLSRGDAVELALSDVPAEVDGPPAGRGARADQLATDAPPPAAAGLTSRQVEILRLLAAGYSNREIAALLFVSERTVEHHVQNIYRKIDAHGRVDATGYAHRHGLVSA